jgi:hypothetical protein
MKIANALAFSVHLALLLLAYRVPHLWVKTGLFVAVSCSSLGFWLAAFKRYHLIADTPTSFIVSAAQGFVELVGRSELHPNTPPLGYMSGPPCVWYRYTVHERTGSENVLISSGESNETFLLRDKTGTCVIDPDGAEVVGAHRKSWKSDEYTYAIEFLAPGDTLYALGELASQSKCMEASARRELVAGILAEWKRDKESLLDRFDQNKDAQIDLQEWEAVRAAAHAEAERIACEDARSPDLHILSAPSDGRPFILSNRPPLLLAKRFYSWAWLHAGTMIAAALVVSWLWTRAGSSPIAMLN